ncbi:hypothetical protein [Leclercia adecarboxylata]|uniref:hypothetical protein n=1 Tax=Leclercia adecarboxylata TaxID=83655 RepID=UPI001F050B77|nr:hypothetical protein [Leclercia adecarboxylata]MCH2683691.1 hypothetical protein [Leclercia adecarboxylata]
MKNNIEYFIGRHDTDSGRFVGPYIFENQLSDIIKLLPVSGPSQVQYVFPDLSPLIRHIHDQISSAFKTYSQEQQDKQLAEEYELIFTHWNRACGMEDGSKKERAWEKVTDKADPLLIHLREAFPKAKPLKDWDEGLIRKIEDTGRLYTEVLLFIIYARAAYECASLGRDPSLREYCRQVKEILAAHTGGKNIQPLMLSAASEAKLAPFYTMLRDINGLGPEDPDSYLAQHVRGITAETLPDDHRMMPIFYNFDVNTVKVRQVKFTSFSSLHWRMVMALSQIHYRVSQLEALLESLIDGDTKVDFDGTDATLAQVEMMIAQLADPQA